MIESTIELRLGGDYNFAIVRDYNFDVFEPTPLECRLAYHVTLLDLIAGSTPRLFTQIAFAPAADRDAALGAARSAP